MSCIGCAQITVLKYLVWRSIRLHDCSVWKQLLHVSPHVNGDVNSGERTGQTFGSLTNPTTASAPIQVLCEWATEMGWIIIVLQPHIWSSSSCGKCIRLLCYVPQRQMTHWMDVNKTAPDVRWKVVLEATGSGIVRTVEGTNMLVSLVCYSISRTLARKKKNL